jgi:hypothetical protein
MVTDSKNETAAIPRDGRVGFEGLGYSERKSGKLAGQLNREVSSRLVRKLLNDGKLNASVNNASLNPLLVSNYLPARYPNESGF